MLIRFIIFSLVLSSCRQIQYEKKFNKIGFKINCDTVNSKFWVQFAASNKYKNVIFNEVQVSQNDSSYLIFCFN